MGKDHSSKLFSYIRFVMREEQNIWKVGVRMNIIIDKDAADYILKHSETNSIKLILQTSGGG